MSSPSNPTTTEPLDARLPVYRKRVETALEATLPSADTLPMRLHEAMRYAVLGTGKRLRPVLVYAAGEAVGVPPEDLDPPACAVELIHAYSLVHDDLPCMDDDDLRRGRATCHRAFDEPTAVLVGDALQSLAFRTLAESPLPVTAATRNRMLAQLAMAAGSRGMAGGQAMDLEAAGADLDLAQLEDLHIHKTGALIRSSVLLGALCATDSDEDRLDRLDRYAKSMGLAFQIRDDILDVTGSPEETGKAAGGDVRLAKATYPGLLGLREAQEHGEALVDRALESLRDFDASADCLRALARFTMQRSG